MPVIEHAGAAIHYDIIDQRLPWLRGRDEDTIVFHHGLGACADVWLGWLPALVAHYRIVRLDMRGHGRSPVPAGYPWTMDALAGDLEALADGAGLGRFHLVGESIGGTTAMIYAARHASRVRTLTVSNGAHRGDALTNLDPWQRIIDDGGMAAWSAHMMQMRFHEGAIDDDAWRWYQAQQASCDRDSVVPAANALHGADLRPELRAITMPVLLLHPDASPFIPLALMAELNAALPDSRLRVFAHTRHGLPFSHAQECAAEYARFLREHG
jgi:pimeloyl-ACP methyl ester carboxylesterase